MKTYFGEYLVQQGLISKEELCEALMIQLSRIPSELELAFANKILNADQILEVIKCQIEDRCDFSKAIVTLELNSKHIIFAIAAAEQKYRVPFGQILLEQKRIDHSKLNAAFDEYMSLRSKESDVSKTVMDSVHQIKFDEEANAISSESINKELFALDLSQINHDMVPDFLEVLEDGKKSELELAMMSWEPLDLQNPEHRKIAEDSMRVLYREYHTLKGTSRFIGGHLTEYLVHRVEGLLSTIMNNLDRCPNGSLKNLSGLNLRVLDCIWEIRNCININGDEKSFLSDPIKASTLSNLVVDLLRMNSEMKSEIGHIDLDTIASNF